MTFTPPPFYALKTYAVVGTVRRLLHSITRDATWNFRMLGGQPYARYPRCFHEPIPPTPGVEYIVVRRRFRGVTWYGMIPRHVPPVILGYVMVRWARSVAALKAMAILSPPPSVPAGEEELRLSGFVPTAVLYRKEYQP